MVLAAHLWPGMTPTYIQEHLSWRDWLVFAAEADAWVREQQKRR